MSQARAGASAYGSSLRGLAALLGTTILLPVVLTLLGVWEAARGRDDLAAFAAEHRRLDLIVVGLQARSPPDGGIDFRMQFARGGQTYVGPLALTEARSARDTAAIWVAAMEWRRLLPPVAVVGGALAAAISTLVLALGAVLGWAGRLSREALAGGFAIMRRALPVALALQIAAATAAFVGVVGFEAMGVAASEVDGAALKLIGVAVVAMGAAIVVAASALSGLRKAFGAFEPDALPVFGRVVTPGEAPGLWRLVDRLAGRLGALKPETVVVGLSGGFFVTGGPAALMPVGQRIDGRLLYLPLPYLALMEPDEIAAVIAHELAHYAGGDTAYSQRFLPIYAGVDRSLTAVAVGAQGSLGLLGPSMRLGLFVMERFHLAVRHWSRSREFAADAASARMTSAIISARALLRSGAVGPRVAEVLADAFENPGQASPDLVEAAVALARDRGLADPAASIDAEQPHPTDTHPPTRARIAALGVPIETSLLASVSAVGVPTAAEHLAVYFSDADALCRAATADFLGAARERAATMRDRLRSAVDDIGQEERVLRENRRPAAIVVLTVAALFLVAAGAFLLLDVPRGQAWIVAAASVAGSVGLAGLGAWWLRQGDRVGMVLRPDNVILPGLDRPIAWDEILDLDMTLERTRMVTRMLLSSETSFPRPVLSRRGLHLDPKRRILTVSQTLPRRMSPQAFADLIASYRSAAHARRILAEIDPASLHDGSPDR